jgi:predicted ATPase/DNA-binding CsgD family transcriptional regulator
MFLGCSVTMNNRKREPLSARQAEIADLVVAGKSSREIAAALFLSPRTVEHHLEAIFNKLGVGSRVELVAALLRPGSPEPGHPAVPPLRSVDAIPNNLPRKLTSFIGREADIAEITALVETHQLVTLVGSGGVGKTRTSLAVAEGVFGTFADGVWLVELAPLSRGEYIPGAVAKSLGLTLAAEGDPVANLTRALKSKRQLLVFDDCEHLVADVAKVVARILNDCHAIKILASSRESLRVLGEATYRLPSLPVPPAAVSGELGVAAALPYAAVALFVDRARAVDHRFTLSDENAPPVADICRRLDGIPLAIELAAARMKTLSPQQLRDRLSERFRVLMGGGRERLPRHQTLRALIDWSHDLLDEREQRLFRRLAIFENGFTLEAASAVGRDDEVDAFEAYDMVASLVDKSLVMADPLGDAMRYHLLESMRAYAAEKLVAAGERESVASRHLRYFRDRFVELRREYEEMRPGIVAAFATELDDLRVALDGALVRCELADGAELLTALGGLWTSGGLGREGIARCEGYLAEIPSSEPRLLGGLGASLTQILLGTGRFAQTCEAGVAAIGHARASGDGPLLAVTLDTYAFALTMRGDFPAAERALTEAEAIRGVPPHRRLLLAECRANLSLEMGDLDSAARAYERLSAEWGAAGFRRHEAMLVTPLAEIEFRRGQYQRAAEIMRHATSLARNGELTGYLPGFLVLFGQVLAVSGATDEAVGAALEAIALQARRDPEHYFVTLAIELLAHIAAAQGDLAQSARLAGYADASLKRLGFSRDFIQLAVYERRMTRLRELLAPGELARLMTEGASLTPEAAIALARRLETNLGRR